MATNDASAASLAQRVAYLTVAAILLLYLLRAVLLLGPNDRWDFNNLYFASQVWFTEGIDPYDFATLQSASEGVARERLVYAPVTLAVVWPFTLLSLELAQRVYGLLVLAAVAGLVVFWQRAVLCRPWDWGWLVFALLAFNSTVYIGLKSGNIAALEQVLIWLALWQFIRERYLFFALLIAVAALFKLVPVALLGLLLLTGERRWWQWLLLGLSAFAVLLVTTSLLVGPPLLGSFAGALQTVPTTADAGLYNPTLHNLLVETLTVLAVRTGVTAVNVAATGLYGLATLVLGVAGWRVAMLARRASLPDAQTWLLAIGLLTFGLALPRLKDYSYILLLVPAYWAFVHSAQRSSLPWLIALAVLPTVSPSIVSDYPVTLPNLPTLTYLWGYTPALTALLAWVLALAEVLRRGGYTLRTALGIPDDG